MIKELTRQEVAKKLAEEGLFDGYVRDHKKGEWRRMVISGIRLDNYTNKPIITNSSYGCWTYCGIEIPEEYEPYPDDVCPNITCGDVVVNKENTKKKHIVEALLDGKHNYQIYLGEIGFITNKALFYEYTKLDGSPIGRIKGSE